MLFVPYPDESKVINMIHEVRNEDYALLRLTPTMIEKNNLDANEIFRDLLRRNEIVDYEYLQHGGVHAISSNTLFIQRGKVDNVRLNFYRVANSRGDRRFSIETIKRKMRAKELNEGDLIYISAYKEIDGSSQLYMINLTNNTPDEEEIITAVGRDDISKKLLEIQPLLKEILAGGPYDNSKGPGEKAPKDIGDTFERLLQIETNNRTDADIDGLIEIKTKGESRTLDTLFTLRPCFEGTPVAEYEPIDRQRVSAFARMYGYASEKHPGCSSLYITIGSENAPQNNQGFYLEVDDIDSQVKLNRKDPETGKTVVTAYWEFAALRRQLYEKHPATLWVTATSEKDGDLYRFKYTEIEFSRSPQFTTFLSLIKSGVVTYDWRGYTTKEGKYSGKNHGNAWRIRPHYKHYLFGDVKKIEFNEVESLSSWKSKLRHAVDYPWDSDWEPDHPKCPYCSTIMDFHGNDENRPFPEGEGYWECQGCDFKITEKEVQ